MPSIEPELQGVKVESRTVVHVAVAVIYGDDGRILVARRPDDKHMGGLWEFPGGKVEAGENVRNALQRELQEELAIEVSEFKPLIQIRHDYPEKTVLLDTWVVSGISGVPKGNEGQQIQWVDPAVLRSLDFPEANKPIINAVLLPDRYMITGSFDCSDVLFSKVADQVRGGIQLVQFRGHWLGDDYLNLARELSYEVDKLGGTLVVKGDISLLQKDWCRGLHLTSSQLMSVSRVLKSRPDQWLVASCHNEKELLQAVTVGVDFVTLSPVQVTKTHPEAIPLGFDEAGRLTKLAPVPVYWLGGLEVSHTDAARDAGAQGIAAMGEFWG